MVRSLQDVPAPVRDVVARLADGLRKQFGTRLMLVRLFGSYARGTPLADSDVDVFVLLDRTEPADRKAVIDLADDLSVEANLEIAPLIFDESRYALWKRQERRLIRDVEQEGISA